MRLGGEEALEANLVLPGWRDKLGEPAHKLDRLEETSVWPV